MKNLSHSYPEQSTKQSQLLFISKQESSSELKEIESTLSKENYLYKNTSFDLYPAAFLVSKLIRSQALSVSEKLINILEKVIQNFLNDPKVQSYFMLDNAQMDLARIKHHHDRHIIISRFDTLFCPSLNMPFKILENNTDCPAGVLFTGRIMRVINQLKPFVGLSSELMIEQDLITSEFSFFQTFLSVWKKREAQKLPTIAILQLKGKASPETTVMNKMLNSLGIKTVLVDPREFIYKGSKLYFGDLVIDLVWNKINTVYFNELLRDSQSINSFIQACRDNAICHINSFPARFITESKLCHAFLYEAEQFCTEEEKEFIKQVLPWSTKLENKTVSFKGREYELLKLALEHKDSFVLKAAYDIRGDGVAIGRSCTAHDWVKLLTDAIGKPYILQEYILPPSLKDFGETSQNLQNKKFSMDFFMFNGKFQGFGSKISDSDKLNIFQGGSKVAVYSVA